MATPTSTTQAWATRPYGKAARVAIAAFGMVLGTVILTAAAAVDTGSWAMVLLGIGLAAAAVRAARIPSISRLVAMGAIALAVPLSLQVF